MNDNQPTVLYEEKKAKKSSSKTGLIIGISIAVIILVIGILVVFGIKLLHNKLASTTQSVQTSSSQEATGIPENSSAASEEQAYITESDYLIDNANLLTDKEKDKLIRKLDRVREQNRFDIVVLTTNSFEGKSAQAFADDYYDEHHYGYGKDADGCILVVNVAEDQRYISTCGLGITALSDEDIQAIGKQFLSFYNQQQYDDAIDTFIDAVSAELKEVKKAK